MKRKGKISYGTEVMYTKKGANNFKNTLIKKGYSVNTRKIPVGYQLQYYKKLKRR